MRALGVPGIKYALDLIGYHGGNPRPPLRPLGDKARHQVREILAEAELLAGESRASS